MPLAELAQIELLAEVDALSESLRRWSDAAPDWPAAQTCRALIRRVCEKLASLRVRIDAPLVVATLGGTGVGKSALVNALVGEEIAQTGKVRPTTRQPVLICRTDIAPEMLGIDPNSVQLVQRDIPALANLVLVDCPDPDTSEEDEPGTNLARLRHILPHCDVLLVASTQQKYRNARVAEELAAAAPGAQLVFVQTHADRDADIRDDWRTMLAEHYEPGRIFRIDSMAALDDSRSGLGPRGEFALLMDLLTRQLAGAAAARIRRANLLDLIDEALAACGQKIAGGLPAIAALQAAIEEHRAKLSKKLAGEMRSELLASRRPWEQRLLGQVASRWGFSPFALVLRLYQGIGGLLATAFLFRARTPAQVALWGIMEGARNWQNRRSRQRADTTAERAVSAVWDESELRSSTLVLQGYAADAGLDRGAASLDVVAAEASRTGQTFIAGVAGELDAVIGRTAQRHTGWFTRLFYELLMLAVLATVLFRPAKNFFYDSWWLDPPAPLLGLEFYLLSVFWLAAGCTALVWLFSGRLRRGLRREIDGLAAAWSNAQPAGGVFARLEEQARGVERFQQDLQRLHLTVGELRRRLAQPEEPLGHRR